MCIYMYIHIRTQMCPLCRSTICTFSACVYDRSDLKGGNMTRTDKRILVTSGLIGDELNLAELDEQP